MISRNLLLGSGVAGVLLAYIFSLEAPDMVAVHFGEDGLPNSWVSNANNLYIWSVFHILIVSFFLAIPVFIRKLPTDLVNLPNKEYWLAPPRREDSLQEMERRFNLFGVFLNTVFIIIGALNFTANKSDPVQMDENYILTVGLFVLIFVVLWVRSFYQRFKMDSDSKNESGAQ